MDLFILALLVLCSLTVPTFGDKGSSKARTCSDIQQFYGAKGFKQNVVPQFEISGEHLRICPQGYTCCTSEMEGELATLTRRETEGLLREFKRPLQSSLLHSYRTFDGYMVDLMNRSMIILEDTFISTWGILYARNSMLFQELYQDLRDYYQSGNVNLEEVLTEFWTKLLEKVFYQANKLSSVGEDYQECVSKKIETLRLFGEAPHKMTTQVTRTFVAARAFLQGLHISREVVGKVLQVPLNPKCFKAIMRMTYCPHCRGMPTAKPCANYCTNVMKGCFANQADLHTEWSHLADTMIEVGEHRLDDMDSVILSLPNQISEALFTMEDNMASINSKLFQACGSLSKGGATGSGFDDITTRKSAVTDSLGGSNNKLANSVTDINIKLREMRPYWISLPKLLCSDRVASGTGAEDKCWNGMSRARYLPEVIGDGLANQINNPEVEIDITKPDMKIRQQIMQLKIMTNKLKNALNGRDVDFQDNSDDVSGSGSGLCSDELCSRGPRLIVPVTERPMVYAYPPRNKEVRSSVSQSLPSISILLLPLVILLLQR
ncbi:PREDICTED: glypican-1-like [Cyprinodon variegatus]|uniref:Glypican-1 n=1 Tax=Cyprinodon variegatus TaxID=28743 RepID=A0A3Q2FNM6_CYPVA|nr:PREDICTED: glypican-1-like [Cyprinodon variegatus]